MTRVVTVVTCPLTRKLFSLDSKTNVVKSWLSPFEFTYSGRALVVADHAGTAAEVNANYFIYPLMENNAVIINADRHSWQHRKTGLISGYERARWVHRLAENPASYSTCVSSALKNT